jgi:hypothetical protein
MDSPPNYLNSLSTKEKAPSLFSNGANQLWLSEERTRGFREALLHARVSFTRMQAGDGFSS